LQRAVDLFLLAACNIGADALGDAFDGFSGDLQARQQLHLFPTVIKSCLLPNQSLHASQAGREFGTDDIELLIRRKLPLMAMRTQVPGSGNFHPTDCGQHGFRAQFPIACLMAAGARHGALLGHGEPQQLVQDRGSGLMHGRANEHLDGFQIDVACLAHAGEDGAQQLL
jgi:hypothetical protein